MHGSAVCKQLASYSLICIIVFPVAKNKNVHSYAAMLIACSYQITPVHHLFPF